MKWVKVLWNVICISGIPWIPISYISCRYALEYLILKHSRPPTVNEINIIWFITFFLYFWILIKNLMWLSAGEPIGLFKWTEKYEQDLVNNSKERRKAQYPLVPSEYLFDEPTGLVLGKTKGKYVCVPIKKGNILNAIIMGTPGSGKSVILLSMLIKYLNRAETGEQDEMTFFALDIKPELAKKSTLLYENPNVKVITPTDRNLYGWDVYYNIRDDSTDDEVISELDTIARALVDSGKNNKNEFFYESARNIMKAVLFYTYKQGQAFMQGLTYLLSDDISSIIEQVIKKVEANPCHKRIYNLLKPYSDKDGSEAFQGIELALRQSLAAFSTEDIKFFLDTNPRKASPLNLESKQSIFFSLPETKIEEYKTLLRLVTMQTMQHCSGRSEESHIITFIIDEAYRLGAINWIDFLSTSRSRQISTILAFQSLTQMESVWSKAESKSLIELCRIVTVLSCTDSETAKMLSEWAGDYIETKHSINNKTTTTSYEKRKILEQSDIMNLQDFNEAVVFIKGKYLRLKVDGARYFNIPKLNTISKKCLEINSAPASQMARGK